MTHDLRPVLDKYQVEYDPDREGNQQVKCVFHGDTHASASVNLGEGVFHCFTCGVAGDAIELLKINEGLEFREAKRLAEDLAGEDRGAVPRRPAGGRGDGFLPRSTGSRPGRRAWVSPWGRG